MARFARYSGTRSLPGVRRPQVIADTAVGRATEALGQQVRRSAGAVGSFAGKAAVYRNRQREGDDQNRDRQIVAAAHRQQVDNFDLNLKIIEHVTGRKEREAELAANARPGAVGYAAAARADRKTEAASLAAKVPDHQREKAQRDLEQIGSELDANAERDGRIRLYGHYLIGVKKGTDALLDLIRSVPNMVDTAFKQGRRLIDESGLITDDKAGAVALWVQSVSKTWVESLPPEVKVELLEQELHTTETLVKKQEGARSEAQQEGARYPDGFDYAPITQEDGSKTLANRGFKRSPEEIAREQRQKIEASRQIVIDAIGQEAWKELPKPARDGLAVVTYHIEEMPGSLREASRTGDPEQVALAIEALKVGKEGVVAEQLQEAADLTRGKSFVSTVPPERRWLIDALPDVDKKRLLDRARQELSAGRQIEIARQIAEDPINLDPQAISDDPLLDDGQKALLQFEHDAAVGDQELALRADKWFREDGTVDPRDQNARENAEWVYQKVLEYKTNQAQEPNEETENQRTAALTVFAQKGVIPPSHRSQILYGLRNADPALVVEAYENLRRLRAIDPNALRDDEEGRKLTREADRWRIIKQYFSHGLGERVIRSGANRQDPLEMAARQLAKWNDSNLDDGRETALESRRYKEILNRIDARFIRFHLSEDYTPLWIGGTPDERIIAVADYQKRFEEAWFLTGEDADKAIALANELFQLDWKPSEFYRFDAQTLVWLPPEAILPRVNGTLDWVHDHIRAALEQQDDTWSKYRLSDWVVSGENLTKHDIRLDRDEIRYRLEYLDNDGDWIAVIKPLSVDAAAARNTEKNIVRTRNVLSSALGAAKKIYGEAEAEYVRLSEFVSAPKTSENHKRFKEAEAVLDQAGVGLTKAEGALEAFEHSLETRSSTAPDNDIPPTEPVVSGSAQSGDRMPEYSALEDGQHATREYQAIELADAAMARGDTEAALKAVEGFPAVHRDLMAHIEGLKK